MDSSISNFAFRVPRFAFHGLLTPSGIREIRVIRDHSKPILHPVFPFSSITINFHHQPITVRFHTENGPVSYQFRIDSIPVYTDSMPVLREPIIRLPTENAALTAVTKSHRFARHEILVQRSDFPIYACSVFQKFASIRVPQIQNPVRFRTVLD